MKNKPAFFIFSFLVLSFLPYIVSADLGPKPTVDIDVTYNGNNISDPSFSAKMLACVSEDGIYPVENIIPELNISEYDSDNDCYWSPSYFAWGGDCRDSKCDFGYGPPSEFKLAVYVPSLDKVFITNKISRTSFYSNYEVELKSDGTATITETAPTITIDSVNMFIGALIITLIIELLVVLIYLPRKKLHKNVLISVLFANLISLPIVWFVFPLFKLILLVISLSLFFAIIFEAYFIHYINKKELALKKAFILSIIMNLASLIIGGSFLLFLTLFGF